ncbi:hypothetical protein C7999DRAFT_31263 [Corynascus novoguineensis]|uniref:Rhodopsin domain-containing protein n=1 Tax=Corynascus novoguineensis TaxID=1126955 RepID=A0AAN7CU46_9PEZI|nr:hypothetical protein C7999DRAFT_31263 [Corynascus novoguineensis]
MPGATASNDASLAGLIPPPTEVNDAHKLYGVIAGSIFMCIAASAMVLWRLYLRLAARKFGLDDYATTFALLCYLTWSGLAIYVNFHAGVGKPLWELTLGEIRLWFQGIVACNFLYPVMSTSIRVSLLVFYRRLFVNPASSAAYRWAINILLALQVVYVVVFCVIPVLVCRKTADAADPFTSAMHCNAWIYIKETIALYSVSLAFDLALLAVPVFPIASLRMPAKKRAGVLVLFLLGVTASGAAAWKLGMYVWELNRLYDIDPRWYNYEMSRVVPPQFDSYGVTFWIPSMLEPTLAMMCASLPGLRPALGRISETLSSVFASTFRRSHPHRQHSDKAQVSGGSDQPMYDWATHTIGGSTQMLHPHSATPSRDGKSKVSHSELSSTVGTIDDDDWRYHPESGGSVRYGLAV